MNPDIRSPELEYDVWVCPECGAWHRDQGFYPGTCRSGILREVEVCGGLFEKVVLVPRRGPARDAKRSKAPKPMTGMVTS